MYIDDKWTAVTGDQLAGFLSQVNVIDNKHQTNLQTTQVAWRSLPFYERVALVRITDPAWAPANLVIYYLTDQGKLYRLNGTSPNIHEVNAKAPIRVTEENVLEYLHFFCFFVRGEEGPFLIVESIDAPYVPQDMDPNTLSVIENTVHPAIYKGMNEQGHFLCDGVVFYSNALFEAEFSVQPSGMIEMLDDNPIAVDLPVKIDAPID